MISIHHKAKQFLLLIIKLLIVSIALYYIYNQLQGDKKINWSLISNYLSIKSVLILLTFSIFNWIFEILKWQNLVNSFRKISFLEAAKHSLGSLTASIFTPNRIGEYGAKMLYFKKENAKRIVFLNFVHNSSQMAITSLFGVIGLIISEPKFKFQVLAYTLIIVTIGILLLLLKDIEIYGFSLQKIITKFITIPKRIAETNWGASFLRYLIFSHQFYYLLLVFNCEIDYLTAFSTICSMYFLASIIPSIHFMDVAVKGSVAVYLFGQIGVESWKIISITSLMWLFNLVLPVLFGSYFVLRFKTNLKTKHIATFLKKLIDFQELSM